jgi:hypothetical protein
MAPCSRCYDQVPARLAARRGAYYSLERLGESLHVMIVRRDPWLSESDLREWSRERIERFKVPDGIHYMCVTTPKSRPRSNI